MVGATLFKKNGWSSDMILPVTVCACGYAHQIHMWEVHITSDNTGSDEGAVLFLSRF